MSSWGGSCWGGGHGVGDWGLLFGCARDGVGVGRLGCVLRLGFPDGEAEGDWGLQDVPENPFDRLGECALHDPLGPFIWRGHHGDPVDEEDGLDLTEHAARRGRARWWRILWDPRDLGRESCASLFLLFWGRG